MQDLQNAFVTRSFLRSVWARDYEAFKNTPEESAVNERLSRWASRTDLKETSSEAAFIEEFFRLTWGYVQSGQAGSEAGFTLWPQFPVVGAGARGGAGSADLAIGFFSKNVPTAIPQVLCEFKDIRSLLDADQKRKGNTRSPVRQCLDYLSHARKGMVGSEPVLPTWALVTDMNEFRLYWYDRGHQQSVRFVIRPGDLFQGRGLLGTDEDARFDRFLFAKLFHRDTLLTTGGNSLLRELISTRYVRDRRLEDKFYAEYRAFRNRLYLTLLEKNPEGTSRFPGTRGRLVRLAQKILDRLIFIFFCEDMGQVLAFPPKLLQKFLVEESNSAYFDADGTEIWQRLLRLFISMNTGAAFAGKQINAFNGGLFAPDAALEALHVPNAVFCQHLQGQNEASIHSYKETVLYLSATYNYASDMRAVAAETSETLGLYTLGRIFEQSITELEILEAEADNRPSLNRESKRKIDGVYYTPEWVVEQIIDGTLGPRLAEIRQECGWPTDAIDLPSDTAIDAYIARLKMFTVLDPACGSGAFLITALRYLVEEWTRVWALRKSITGKNLTGEGDEDALIRDILRSNIYGVDINAASVEIARLALWLHTARGDRPLSHLENTIREGNSLIGPEFYKGIQAGLYDDEERERINDFDWEARFPVVFAHGGFDAIVGNPPYVKLQEFQAVHADMADYLVQGRPALGIRPYASTRTGSFDLYLPFIEKGLALLNDGGRLGYIAPSLWTVNEYGKGLRGVVAGYAISSVGSTSSRIRSSRRRRLTRRSSFLPKRRAMAFESQRRPTEKSFLSHSPTPAARCSTDGRNSVTAGSW